MVGATISDQQGNTAAFDKKTALKPDRLNNHRAKSKVTMIVDLGTSHWTAGSSGE